MEIAAKTQLAQQIQLGTENLVNATQVS